MRAWEKHFIKKTKKKDKKEKTMNKKYILLIKDESQDFLGKARALGDV